MAESILMFISDDADEIPTHAEYRAVFRSACEYGTQLCSSEQNSL
jgi:hypothetical protein